MEIYKKEDKKVYKKNPENEDYKRSLFLSQTQNSTNYSMRSNQHQITVEKQTKLDLNSFDDKRLYLDPMKSLPWDKHTQAGDCQCILCIKFIGLYYKELTQNRSDEGIYYNNWYWKQTLNHEQLLKLISDRAQLL